MKTATPIVPLTASFNKKQADVYMDTPMRVMALVGAIRSGKTHVSYFLFLKYLLRVIKRGTNGDIVIIAKTVDTAFRNVVNPMIRIFGDKFLSYNTGLHVFTVFGRPVFIFGANDESSESKLRGMTIAVALGDEVTTWVESMYVQLMGRMSSEGSMAILTTNPDSSLHWFKTKYLDRAIGTTAEQPLQLKHYKFSLDDNAYLSEEYKQSVRAEYTGVFYRRYILGEWCMAEGLIYDMFDPEIHQFPNDKIVNFPICRNYFVGVDYGTGTVSDFGLFGEDDDNHVYLLRSFRYEAEKQKRQKTDVEYTLDLYNLIDNYSRELREEFGPENLHNFPQNPYNVPCYIDPTASSFITQLYRSGFNYVIKANNDVVDGIRTVQAMLALRKYHVHKSCISDLLEFGTYSWDEKAQLKGEDKPIKRNDHALDRTRYALHSRVIPRGSAKLMGKGVR